MISYPKVNKLIAGCEINLANYPNKEIQGIFIQNSNLFLIIHSEKNEIINLTRTSDCKVTLYFNIKSILVSELVGNERYRDSSPFYLINNNSQVQ
jgi:hypothetical protein